MGLGRFLKRKLSGDESLVDLIDKELKNRPLYDEKRVEASIKSLYDYTTSKKKDSDEFRKLFFNFWAEISSDLPRSGKRFHPSGLRHECSRKIYYEFTDVEPSDKVVRTIDGKLQRIFDTGTWIHIYIQVILYKAGILVQAEVPLPDGGHADGIILFKREKMLLEIKTTNSRMYEKARLSPFEDHKYQTAIYAKKLGLKKVCYLYINKDTSDIHVHIQPLNEPYAKMAFEKMDDITNAVSIKKAPERVCTSIADGQARKCPFAKHCFTIKPRARK